ncbi:S28 family serine protease, partial [Staphylococcus aureus]|nr:S28 family serine protease [Staphylococcus aureus]
LCQRLFAMPKAQTTDLVHTRYFEPLLTSVTTNILFTRGTLDPWSALALSPRDQGSLGQGSFIKEIPGAYHCDDLGVGGSPAVV